MTNKTIILTTLLASLILAVLLSTRTSNSANALLAGTTNIVFQDSNPRDCDFFVATHLDLKTNENRIITFALTNQTELQRIIGLIEFHPKKPCECGPHLYEATFQRNNGPVHVSFCNHCFDVLGEQSTGSKPRYTEYAMPKEFYAEFRRLADNQIDFDRLPR
jgi:hypothetical protein